MTTVLSAFHREHEVLTQANHIIQPKKKQNDSKYRQI